MLNDVSVPSEILIVGIPGSLRKRSYTRMALEIALAGAREVGAQTKLLDLRDYALPLCGGKEAEAAYPIGVGMFRNEVRKATGILLGTPEYHGSYSGVLKNAIDLLGFREFEGKMVGLLGVSGGILGAANALNDMRSIVRALHAWTVPEQVAVPEAWKLFAEDGTLNHAGLDARLRSLGRSVARFSFLHSSDEMNAFIRAWQSAPVNPGG